jgi:DNA-binding SARP family transcriptional activator
MRGLPVSSAPIICSELDFCLLGGFQLWVDGVPLDELRSGRARSLLAFLVLEPNVAHSRRALAAMFWPDSTDQQARTNLRNVLHLLRHAAPALDAPLRAGASTLEWRPSGQVRVDVHRFDGAVAAVFGTNPDDTDELILRCRAAAERYAGEFLLGDFDDWVVARRAELKDKYRDVLRRLAIALVDSGRADEATTVARELVRTDPVDEIAHRLCIEAHGRAGDRAGAIRAYHECVATLARELGVRPDPATVVLYHELVDERSHGALPALPHSASGGGHRLIGRQHEWDLLRSVWRSAQPGLPSMVIVSGEPGIGKTRLLEEIREFSAAAGASICGARCYAGERTLGNSVVVAWLRSPMVAVRLRELNENERRTLTRLLPELADGGRAEWLDVVDDSAERRRFFDAVARALTLSSHPTLLLVDDAQWSDDASLEFIQHVARQPFEVPIVVVLTVRYEEVDPDHPLTAMRNELIAFDRLTEIRLSRLPATATVELGSELRGTELDEVVGEALFTESEGNPLVIVEMVRSGWNGTSPMTITPRLRAVIDARFRQLSDHATEVLHTVAVVARPCSAALLGAIAHIETPELVRGVDELWQRGILIESGTDAYEFSHGKLREAAYDAIGPARRRALHAATATACIASTSAHDRTTSGVIAAHFVAAHMIDEAVVWLHRAALDAQAMFAYGEATQLLEQALDLVPELSADVRHVRELELLSSLPGVLAGVDGYGTSRMSTAHARAVMISSSLGRELAPSFVRSMVMAALCRDEFAQAAASAEQLRFAAVARGDESLEVESHYLSGISAFWAAELDEAARHFTTVLDRFDVTTRHNHHTIYGHDPYVVCQSRLANTLWFLGRENEAVSACDAALAAAAQVGHPLSHDTAAIFSCVLAIDLCDPGRLETCTSLLGSLGMNSFPHVTKREALLGLLDVHAGHPDVGVARISAALDNCRGRNFYPGFQQTIMRSLLAAHEVINNPGAGLRAVERALATGGTPLWAAEAHRLRAVFLHAQRVDPNEVANALNVAREVAHRQGARGHQRRISATCDRLAISL